MSTRHDIYWLKILAFAVDRFLFHAWEKLKHAQASDRLVAECLVTAIVSLISIEQRKKCLS